MDDQIPVNYDTIEQLFCLKTIEQEAKGQMKTHVPTKVCQHVLYYRCETHNLMSYSALKRLTNA